MKQKIYSTIFFTVFLSLVGVSAVQAVDTTSTLRSEEISTNSITANTAEQASLTLIYNDTVVFQDVATFEAQTFLYRLPDSVATAATAGGDALSLLLALDAASSEFNITHIQQYDFGSGPLYYIQCIEINGEEACADWQYMINSAYSFSSIDQQPLADGDELLLYFGSQYAISIDEANDVAVGSDINSIIEEYNPQTPGYEPLANATLALLENPDATSSLSTATTDETGTATFTAPTISGTYYIGYDQGGYYWPTQEIQILPIPTQNINLRIETPDSTLFAGTVAMPESCSVIETTTTTPHEFTEFNAICALQEASNQEFISSYQVTDWGFAFAIDQINDVTNAEDWSETWLVYHNNEAPDGGINTFSLVTEDELVLTYGPWPMSPLAFDISTTTLSINATSTITITTFGTSIPLSSTTTLHIGDELLTSSDGTFSWVPKVTGTIDIYAESDGFTRTKILPFTIISENTQTITEEEPTSSGGNGGGCSSCGADSNSDVDTVVKNIITFLDANQNSDGSFSSSVSFSDWTALAYNAYTGTAIGKDALKAYLLTNPSPIDGPNTTTAYARRAMALMSYGINPYSGTNTNYIEKILEGFDGTQFGIEGLINDDVFALIPLLNAGYIASDPIVVSTTKYILEKQDTTGKFESPDITGATLQVLSKLTVIDGVNTAIEKGTAYILDQQKSDGGFGDIYGTSWIIQGLSAQNVDIKTLKKNNFSPIDYLKANQEADGGIGNTKNSLRLWTSAWAVPALLEKPWPTLLTSFSIPSDSETQSTGGSTTTEDTTTSTPEIAEQGTSTSTDALADETTSENTSEVTILPLPYDTQEAVGYGIGGGIDDQTIEQNVAGVKITNNTVPLEKPETQEDEKTEKRVEEPLFEEATATIQENSSGNGTKPIHYAFGTTILLGLLLGWRFLRTLV